MDINKFVDGQMAACARNDMVGMLADAGHALVQTGLKVNGARYQDVLVGPLMVKAAAALEECWKREGLIQAAAKPDKPGDVVVKITVPDRWPMTEAGQRRAAQEAAADVAPVRHGLWIPVRESEMTGWQPELAGRDPIGGYVCSVCKEEATFDCNDEFVLSNYCPNCGAKMDGGNGGQEG